MSGLAKLLLLLLVAALGLPQDGAEEQRRTWIETVVPRMQDARSQLGHARRLKREMAEKTGEEVPFWRKLTVEAYQALRVFHPEEHALAAEAAFRAGEILRVAGETDGALEEFRWAEREGRGTPFRIRARLEIGHLHRRAGRWREALQAYLDAAAEAEAEPARREDAWLWAGSAWKELGRVEEARTAWKRVAGEGTDPLARIVAYDELCLLLLEDADLEGAAGMLDECVRALSPRALEETADGERVRRALLRMRAVEELRRAIARRKDSSAEQGTSRNS